MLFCQTLFRTPFPQSIHARGADKQYKASYVLAVVRVKRKLRSGHLTKFRTIRIILLICQEV
jgi:hypothetical protein